MEHYTDITRDVTTGPAGPDTVAFFDLDGTVIFGYSIMSVFLERVTSGGLSPQDAIRQFFQLLGHGISGTAYSTLLEEAAESLAGVPEQEFVDIGERVFDKYLAGAIYPESRALIRAHQQMGHQVVIISSATRYQVLWWPLPSCSSAPTSPNPSIRRFGCSYSPMRCYFSLSRWASSGHPCFKSVQIWRSIAKYGWFTNI